jgi:transitional endoplasmic reticulum ATPase
MQTKELSIVPARRSTRHAAPSTVPAWELSLAPAQRLAENNLIDGLTTDGVDALVLRGDAGLGKTTILESVQQTAGGILLGMEQFADVLVERHPGAIEEAFRDLIEYALASHDLVIVDDLHLVTSVAGGCSYPRENLLDAMLTAVLASARERGKKLLFAVDDDIPWPLRRRAYSWTIANFTPADYEAVCRGHLSSQLASQLAERLDYEKIHRFAPMLNAHQLRNASVWLRRENALDTDGFIEYLKAQDMQSNVEIEEVAKVDLKDLKGIDAVIQALEAKIALPFENSALAAELGLKAKRGVLLAGPPGTGKTTVGRALAHRLKSKFFLIDGTMIAGSHDFFGKINRVFEAAKKNAPAVIFIDDADVIFEGEGDRGFCRYLLTMMDGLEGASAERVCVIMTAMEPGSLPAAVLRSGRVELWLEMRLPDQEARSAILRGSLAKLSASMGDIEVASLAAASRGLTGADIKAVVEDGKLLFAYDKANALPMRRVEDYFLEAIETVRANRLRYARRKGLQAIETVRVGFKTE